MTGDASPETLLEIMDQLYDGYYILKAPHHGTASGYSNLFADMSAAHILISNGEYHAGGAVAQAYIDRRTRCGTVPTRGLQMVPGFPGVLQPAWLLL